MLELGDEAVEAHRSVGRMAVECGVDRVVAVGGDLVKQLAFAAGASGVPEVTIVADNATASTYVQSILHREDTVLVKGSQGGMRQQKAEEALAEPGSHGLGWLERVTAGQRCRPGSFTPRVTTSHRRVPFAGDCASFILCWRVKWAGQRVG
ncbi:hypothetical protein ABVB69_38055 [Streptomyces sp. NPDC000349]|uniref:hypothetical protein n=1 Tax=Streptomyces sp. NPDC000349 TaxID=3154249 RepID=UPI00336A5322